MKRLKRESVKRNKYLLACLCAIRQVPRARLREWTEQALHAGKYKPMTVTAINQMWWRMKESGYVTLDKDYCVFIVHAPGDMDWWLMLETVENAYRYCCQELCIPSMLMERRPL